MARTNSTAVLLAIDTELSTTIVNAFIDDASAWVDSRLADQDELNTTELTLIEKYLACHFITLRDPRVKDARVKDALDTYQRNPQMSEYLEMAMALDPTGIIKDAFMETRPTFRFLAGTGYEDN